MWRLPIKPETTEDILELMNGSIYAAVVGTAMESGLFWLLADKPLTAGQLSQALNIPYNRCHYWLVILCQLGLLEESTTGYSPSTLAKDAILGVQSQETWAFQSREDRDLTRYVRDLAQNIHEPMTAWSAETLAPADYSRQVEQDSAYIARFTRKLYDIHRSLADQLASMLDLRGVRRLLDLGGGSGVISLAFLRKSPQLTSLVMDTESVCRVGRLIASENGLAQRITYLAGDFMKDDLPAGFDMVLLCDVGVFSESLFRKIHRVLNLHGRLVIVDKFATGPDAAPPSRLLSAFLTSLESPAPSIDYITTEAVQTRLQQAGFGDITVTPVPPKDHLPWNIDWTMIEARKISNGDSASELS